MGVRASRTVCCGGLRASLSLVPEAKGRPVCSAVQHSTVQFIELMSGPRGRYMVESSVSVLPMVESTLPCPPDVFLLLANPVKYQGMLQQWALIDPYG